MAGVERHKDILIGVGIYDLDGDRLKIARLDAAGADDRPADFRTKPGSPFSIYVYERGDPAPAPAKKKRPEFVRAEVTLYLGRDGVAEPEQVLKTAIKDKATLAKFAACFPDLGTGKKNGVAGGWLPRVAVDFEGDGGVKARVLAIWTNWSEGGGDWKVRGNLMKHAGELFGIPRLIDQGLLMDPWQIVSFEQGGKKRHAKNAALTVSDCDLNLVVDGKAELDAHDYNIDPSKKPKEIDLTVRDGVGRKQVQAIYSLEENTLKICVDRSGGIRPAAFETRPGNEDQILLVLRKKAE